MTQITPKPRPGIPGGIVVNNHIHNSQEDSHRQRIGAGRTEGRLEDRLGLYPYIEAYRPVDPQPRAGEWNARDSRVFLFGVFFGMGIGGLIVTLGLYYLAAMAARPLGG